ncbi:MAG: nucleoside-diphosphate-sugar epimerase [Bermanella sp.]
MKILVAGASGFIGSSFLRKLDKLQDIDVMVLSRSSLTSENYIVVNCDWREAYSNSQVVEFKPEIIVNLVGSSHPRSSVGKEVDEIELGLLPFIKLIDVLRHNLKLVVFASSAGAIYESGTNIRHKARVDTPYLATKLSVELYLEAVSLYSNCSFVSLRISNPVGLQNKAGFGVVNFFSELVLRNEEPKFLGDYTSKKDYVDVSDVSDAILSLLLSIEKLEKYSYFDIGSGFAFSAVEIYELINKFNALGEVDWALTSSALDLAKIREVTGWRPVKGIVNSMFEVYMCKKDEFERLK